MKADSNRNEIKKKLFGVSKKGFIIFLGKAVLQREGVFNIFLNSWLCPLKSLCLYSKLFASKDAHVQSKDAEQSMA